ncbi:MAG TPA: 2,3-oxidosqualene cyclase [Nannocystis exedens]|nr:2,3-oxidosqualene cyclase [Nannocystis exedens]
MTSTANAAAPDLDAGRCTGSHYQRAVDHLQRVQQDKGAFAGEVVWNTMLVSQYVMTMHVVDQPIAADRRRRIRQSYELQVRDDGGFGMHPDSESFLFHTTLAYIALRLLGEAPEDPLVAGALRWIHNHGGPVVLPTWGRVWLALLGLYPWASVQPIVPEIWLLPEASPFHPRRLYCHMRLIYLGLSYAYGARLCADEKPILAAIRDELYPEGYERVPFDDYRHQIAITDLFEAPNAALRLAFAGLRVLDRVTPTQLRRRALDHAFEHIQFELRSTGYVCLSPVNGLLFTLALNSRNADDPELAAAIKGLEYWFWEDDIEGLRIVGARSDIWDTSFTIQALCEGPTTPNTAQIVGQACTWLSRAQILADIADGARHHRAPAAGGWGFATEDHPWPVSDCTAEATEALLRAAHLDLCDGSEFDPSRTIAAIRFILLRQNDDGGFGSYEARRGSMVIRHFNPAEMYGNCMLEYSYAECTASCIRGLACARKALGGALPTDLAHEVDRALQGGRDFLLKTQDPAGGWPGFWGVNFTYGTFFAAAALFACGLDRAHPALVRACRWLCRAQRADGGWGESYRGVVESADIPLPAGEPSLVVQTAWATLTLMQCASTGDSASHQAIERGIAYLGKMQREDGSWPPEKASGVFFNTAVLDYRLYRQTFPTWALARYLGDYQHRRSP